MSEEALPNTWPRLGAGRCELRDSAPYAPAGNLLFRRCKRETRDAEHSELRDDSTTLRVRWNAHLVSGVLGTPTLRDTSSKASRVAAVNSGCERQRHETR